ncbi:type I DNA topoisomerase [Candidatus Roizmanbacteria bacterium]|nr:type I DNA topoisomerase [Candidatus Roizmanbacteria bacterium]
MSLIIVESPTKARTFNRILKATSGKSEYFVFATMGHFRDLPHSSISIDYTQNFKPNYEIIKNKEKVVDQLKKLAAENKEIILATDLDREGESISYHAAYVLGLINEDWPNITFNPKKEIKRIVFHEITSHALQEALQNPGTLRVDLIKAQQARRILDRVVGYELSPLLWKKMGKNWLSAGRVQTVALRLIVEREKEINAFHKEPYSQIYGIFNIESETNELKAKLISKGNIPYEQKNTLNLFAGEYEYAKTSITKEIAQSIQAELAHDAFTVSDIKESIQNKYPPPPFTTSLLQQEAFHRFGFTSRMTMKLAQDLYERGLITYHRTDSFNLSTQFVFRAKDYITARYGEKYALEKPRGYRTKSRMAQEAHEAIRPTKLENEPNSILVKKKGKKKSSLTQNHEKLYSLIFARAVSTQMKEANIRNIQIIVSSQKGYNFLSEKHQVLFDGFLKVLNPEFIKSNSSSISIEKGSISFLVSVIVEELETKPPPRYNEGTLIKILEEKGIGRPSTYAPIISLIQTKNYVEKDFRYFLPTKLGHAISDYLSTAFPNIFNLDFTAVMEDGLDSIAEGKKDFIQLLQEFNGPFQKELSEKKLDTSPIDVEEEIDEQCVTCGSKLVIRYSRFGKFMACSKYPTCKFTKSFLKTVPNKKCPDCSGDIVIRFTKSRKRFYGCSNYPKCKFSAWVLSKIK